MGLDINAVRFLIAAQQEGVRLGEVLTIGRQDLNVFPAKMRQLLSAHRLPDAAFVPGAKDSLFAEPVFKAVGADRVCSMDISDFEGAEFVHDLNHPIPAHLKQRFDTVYDGGTLEHIFNFPVALKNCMEMVKPGGALFVHTCANNYCGHGFYQFSPELFFRTLSPDNGFVVERMVIHRVGPYGRWFEVSDPERIRGRVELVTTLPMQLLVRARRTELREVFARIPQQSDYTPRWQKGDRGGDAAPEPGAIKYVPVRSRLADIVPGMARFLHVARMGINLVRTQTLFNRACFRPVKKP